jgi:hypothetical protein
VAVVVEVVCSAMAVDRLWRGCLQRDGCRQVVEKSSVARWLWTGCGEVVYSVMAVDRVGRGRLQRDGCRQVVVEVVCSAMAANRLW